VFITIKDATSIVVAQVKEIVEGEFTIEINKILDDELSVDWFVIN